jgi:hypothetical protein
MPMLKFTNKLSSTFIPLLLKQRHLILCNPGPVDCEMSTYHGFSFNSSASRKQMGLYKQITMKFGMCPLHFQFTVRVLIVERLGSRNRVSANNYYNRMSSSYFHSPHAQILHIGIPMVTNSITNTEGEVKCGELSVLRPVTKPRSRCFP